MHKTNTTIRVPDPGSRTRWEGRASRHTIPTSILWLAALFVSATGQLYGQAVSTVLPPGEGKELVEQTCTQCHGLRTVLMLRDGPVAWKNKVDRMILHGTQLLPEEAESVTRYLAKNFGPVRDPMKTGRVPGAAPKSLPAGDGKDLVETRCTVCHDAGIIIAVNRTKDDWASIVKDMFTRGPSATPEEIQAMTSYLAVQFGKKAD